MCKRILSGGMSTSAGALSPNPPIIAFQHCDTANYILCFDRVPQICPRCRTCLDDPSVALLAPPVRLPSVVVNARSSPHSLVVRLTSGTFLQSYTPGSFLHAGITNSKGVVFSFDEKGVGRDAVGWEQSVVVPLLGPSDYELRLEWDALLQKFSGAQCWLPQHYQEETHNCFDFVVGFLNHVEYNETVKGIPHPTTREELCKDYIVAMTTKAARHIELYRTIEKEGYVIQEDI